MGVADVVGRCRVRRRSSPIGSPARRPRSPRSARRPGRRASRSRVGRRARLDQRRSGVAPRSRRSGTGAGTTSNEATTARWSDGHGSTPMATSGRPASPTITAVRRHRRARGVDAGRCGRSASRDPARTRRSAAGRPTTSGRARRPGPGGSRATCRGTRPPRSARLTGQSTAARTCERRPTVSAVQSRCDGALKSPSRKTGIPAAASPGRTGDGPSSLGSRIRRSRSTISASVPPRPASSRAIRLGRRVDARDGDDPRRVGPRRTRRPRRHRPAPRSGGAR